MLRLLPIFLLSLLLIACGPESDPPTDIPTIDPNSRETADVQANLGKEENQADAYEPSEESNTLPPETESATINSGSPGDDRPVPTTAGVRMGSTHSSSEEEPPLALPESSSPSVDGFRNDNLPPTLDEAPEEISEAPTSSMLQSATEAWDQLLDEAVNDAGQVNYGLIKNEVATLDAYLEATATGPPSGILATRAFWINQYNAYTIKLILENWPVASIQDLHGGNPWDHRWIEIAGETLSLNQIEFNKLRPGDTDARIHFAVNCAAASCPPLHDRLFTADNVNSTLARLSSRFVNNASYNRFDRTPWQLSKIFDWYGDDFGDLEIFIMEQAEGEVRAAGNIEFVDYDWSLND